MNVILTLQQTDHSRTPNKTMHENDGAVMVEQRPIRKRMHDHCEIFLVPFGVHLSIIKGKYYPKIRIIPISF